MKKKNMASMIQRPAQTIGVPLDHTTNEGLHVLVQRLRVKAESCRLAMTESDPILRDPVKRRQCIDRAGEIGAVLWVLRAEPLNAALQDEWFELGAASCATADAVETLGQVRRAAWGGREQRCRALELLAEAQTMLRVAHERAQKMVFGYLKHGEDPEQRAAYEYARNVARQEHCLIDRFLRRNDVASPDEAEDLRMEIRSFREQCETAWGLGTLKWTVTRNGVTTGKQGPRCS